MLDITRGAKARATSLRAILLAAWIAAFAALAGRADAQELTILRYEPLADLVISESGADAAASSLRISFVAYGTPFAMTLARNGALTSNLPADVLARLAATTFYSGTLNGNAESWVRITRTGDAFTGAMWDGADLYAIEPFARVAPYAVNGAALEPTDIVIYRWSDTLSAATDVLEPLAAPSSSNSSQKVRIEGFEAAESQLKLAPAMQLDIGLLGDSEFVQSQGAGAEATLLSIANVVDGIYLDQLGVHINVAELHTYAEPDAFAGTNASALLDQLEAFKYDTPSLRSRGVVHLLTGRDLDERPGAPPGSRLLGIANIHAVCHERMAASLTQFTLLSTASLVAAHEIGHNLGAPHDAEASSPCAATPESFIMSPFFNGSRQFSECSVQQMEAELASATCLTQLPANDLSVQPLTTPPAQVLATREFQIDFVVDYGGGAPPLEPVVTITATNAKIFGLWLVSGAQASCISVPDFTKLTCSLGGLSTAGGRVTFPVRLNDAQVGPAALDVDVTALNDYSPANNHYRFDLDVVPENRFVLAETHVPVAVKPKQTFEMDWTVRAEGTIAATNVRAEFKLLDPLDFIELQTPNGTVACVRAPLPYDEQWSCPLGTMAPGASVPLKLKVRSDPVIVLDPGTTMGGSLWLKLVADEPAFNYDNEWHQGVQITPTIVDLYLADFVAPASATVGTDVTITLRVGNRGPDTALKASSRLYAWTGQGLTFNSATSSRGTCAKDVNGSMLCTFGAVASGEMVEVVVQATVGAQALEFSLQGSAGTPEAFDTDTQNNDRLMTFRATAVPPPAPVPAPPSGVSPVPAPVPAVPAPVPAAGSGGGGGSVDLVLLLLLVSAAVCRYPLSSRRRRHPAVPPVQRRRSTPSASGRAVLCSRLGAR